jgi:hypothetical protein
MNELLLLSCPPSIEFPANSHRHVGFLRWGDLRERLKIPSIQREIDMNWVETLKRQMEEGYRCYGHYKMGHLHLCYCQGELYLIDGQHRYRVLCELGIDEIEIEIVIEEVLNKEEMNDVFMRVNASRPSVICRNSNHQLIVNGFRKYMNSTYGCYLSGSRHPHRPHIHLDTLVEKIEELCILEKLQIDNPEVFIEMVEKMNRFYRGHRYNLDKWKSWSIPDVEKVLDKVHYKSPANPLYLGIYTHYEWLDRLLECQKQGINYEDIPHLPIHCKRRKITEKLRKRVWRKTNSGMDGHCYVCQGNIQLENFECGHVKAVFWGVTNDLDNLFAICRECNLDMGVQNLQVYKQNKIKI